MPAQFVQPEFLAHAFSAHSNDYFFGERGELFAEDNFSSC